MVDRLVNSEANARRIALVESCFGASGQPLAVPGRVLVGEGVLTKMCRKKPKPRQVFLFNDILVYGNIVMSKKRYNQQHIIPLEEVQLSSLDDNGQHRNGWLIKTPTKSFAVYAATATEKTEWMAHINKCVQDLLNKSGKKAADTHAAVWVPDDAATTCQHCQRVQFNVIQRRHHCRKCGRVVCGPCSSKKILLPHQSSKPLRCCLACYDEVSAASKAGHGVNRPATETDDLMEFDETIDESVLDAYLDPLEEHDEMLGDFASECDDDEEEADLDIDTTSKSVVVEAVNLHASSNSNQGEDASTNDKKNKKVAFDDEEETPEITGILTDATDAPSAAGSKTKDGESVSAMISQFASSFGEIHPKVPKRFKKIGKMVTRRLSTSTQPKPAPEITVMKEEEADQDAFVETEEQISVASEVGELQEKVSELQEVDVDDDASLIENYYLTSSFVSYTLMARDKGLACELEDIPETESDAAAETKFEINFGSEVHDEEEQEKPELENERKDLALIEKELETTEKSREKETAEDSASSQNSWKNPATVAKQTTTLKNLRDATGNDNSSDDDSDDDVAGSEDAASNPQMLQQTMMFYEGGEAASPAGAGTAPATPQADNEAVEGDKLV